MSFTTGPSNTRVTFELILRAKAHDDARDALSAPQETSGPGGWWSSVTYSRMSYFRLCR